MRMERIKINGEIGFDIFAEDIEAQLKEAKNKDIEIIINSPGGSVFEGVKIYNLLNEHNGQKIVTIDSLAASMATYIAMAGDLIAVKDNATFMIHNAWGFAMGDYRDMQKTAEVLEGLSSLIAKKYAEKTNKDIKEIRALMNEETWLFGDEIVKTGFADELIETNKDKDKNAMLALNKERFKALSQKLKEKEEDDEKIAALLKDVYKSKANDGQKEKANNIRQLELAKAKLKLRLKEI